jgi:hypothetical protein
MPDFRAALGEVQPAFGANTESLSKHVMQGVIDYGEAHRHLTSTLNTLLSQVRFEGHAAFAGVCGGCGG